MKLVAHIQQSKLLYFHKNDENVQISENKHYLFMLFNSVVQSVMLKREPHKLVLPHQYLMLLPLLFLTPKKIVELGLGGGNLLRFIHRTVPKAHLTSVESNINVIEYFHQFFNPAGVPVTIDHEDGNSWVKRHKNINTDWLIIDTYKHDEKRINTNNICIHSLERLPASSWLSINLPDLQPNELELTLKHLSLAKKDRAMIYFTAPQYKNVIVHLAPIKWQGSNFESSPLPNHQIKRWSNTWRHGLKPFI